MNIYLKDEYKRAIFLLQEWILCPGIKFLAMDKSIRGFKKLVLNPDESEGNTVCKTILENWKF